MTDDLNPIENDIDDTLDDDTLSDLGVDVDEFADEVAAAETAPDAIAETVGFFDAGVDALQLDDLQLEGRVGVLERLGPAHFRSKGFSFMGFLQTVYEHVAGEVSGKPKPTES
ncbi:MAG: hypothetical protein QM754_14645 [Tepidisphaeraceae bacterium]